MTDPFAMLREPVQPVDPDPAFAAALRARLERAVLDPTSEATMTTTAPTPTSTPAAVRLHSLTPYLRVVDAYAAVEFYVAAFGATGRGDPFVLSDGRVAHVEVAIGDSVLMMADANPEIDLVAPRDKGGPTGSVRIEVADPDAAFAAAVAAGATVERPVADEPYGRGGVVHDPSGNRLMIAGATPQVRPGDVTYVSLWTRDVDRAVRFFGAVLGWECTPDHAGQGRQVTTLTSGHIGIWPSDATPTAFLCYAVDDIDAAVEVVRAAGGTAQDATSSPYGQLAQCVDDQGIPFALHQADGAPPATEPGGLGYVELRAPDPARVRAFYGSVLGLRYLPGSAPGYWHPGFAGAMTRPVAGLTTGHEAVAVPGFVVTDLDEAVVAVEGAGGMVGAVERRGHGGVADCVDDQGMAFGLHQL